MKSIYPFIGFCLYIFSCSCIQAEEECCIDYCGKVDVGPTFIHVDVLESGKTVKKMDMGGFKADAAYRVWKAVCLKPCIIYGNGQGELISAGAGLGFCMPLNKQCTFTPIVGCTYTQLQTRINLDLLGLKLRHLKERFRSVSPYLALEATYCIFPNLRICAQYQYAWSRTHTVIKHLTHSKSRSRGSNYAAMLEYDLNPRWSVNFGGAYNESLTEEKHGLRGYGFKAGAVYWF